MPNIYLFISQPTPDNEELIRNIVSQINWIFSLIIGVILSISANIATPHVQNLIGFIFKERGIKRVKRIQQELSELESFEQNRSLLMSYAIRSLILILLLFGIAETINSLKEPLFFAIDSIIYANRFSVTLNKMAGGYSFPISLFIHGITGICYVKGVLVAQDILITFQRVNNFSRYKRDQELIIQKLNENQK